MKFEIVIIRACEKCCKVTKQVLEFNSWFELQTTCTELNPDTGEECGEIHIFTLTHLRRGLESREPLTRYDLLSDLRTQKKE